MAVRRRFKEKKPENLWEFSAEMMKRKRKKRKKEKKERTEEEKEEKDNPRSINSENLNSYHILFTYWAEGSPVRPCSLNFCPSLTIFLVGVVVLEK